MWGRVVAGGGLCPASAQGGLAALGGPQHRPGLNAGTRAMFKRSDGRAVSAALSPGPAAGQSGQPGATIGRFGRAERRPGAWMKEPIGDLGKPPMHELPKGVHREPAADVPYRHSERENRAGNVR